MKYIHGTVLSKISIDYFSECCECLFHGEEEVVMCLDLRQTMVSARVGANAGVLKGIGEDMDYELM
jgi:hypothetical protein